MSFRIVAGAACLFVCYFAGALAQSAPAVDFESQVHPVLAAKCLSCHSDEKRSGGLALATYAGVLEGGRSGAGVKPGKSAESLLLMRIEGQQGPRMPLGNAPLTPPEMAMIRAWIDQGARAAPTSAVAKAKWEAPLELNRPAVPQASWSDWKSPLDRFVAAYLQKHSVPQATPVPDAIFARRVYLDVWGLLPGPEELQAFLAAGAPDKRQKLVETLLADSEKYSENWITFWNDLLRNDEGVGYAGSRKSITEWLLPALRSNTPYDQIVGKLLNPAGPGDPDGFLIGVNWRGDINASQTPYMQAAQNTAQIFLGLNLKCNSCHDSFISKWKLKDAYALAGYFAPDAKLAMFRCDNPTGSFAEPAFLFPQLNRRAPSASLADRRATIASIFTDPRDGRLARTMVNRLWQRFLGRGIVDPPDEMDGEPWSPELLDWLASDFAEHGYDLKRLMAAILTSRTYQMPSGTVNGGAAHEYVFRGPEVRRITAEQFADAIGSITGEWRVYQSPGAKTGIYSREWHVAASPLTRALGRPIRDQVISVRNNEATTLQALELVNGEKLTHWLTRGAKKLLGQLPPEPAAVFDSGSIRMPAPKQAFHPVAFDVDISGVDKVWLLVQDVDSYAPDKVDAVWGQTEFIGAGGAVTRLSSLKPAEEAGIRSGNGPIDYQGSSGVGLRVNTPSRLTYDIAGKGFTRLRGVVALENSCLKNDINPRVRFFAFAQEPNMERLVSAGAQTPVPAPVSSQTAGELVNRVFWYALGRAPTQRERLVAEDAVSDPADAAKPSAGGLADLLWAILMTPEFQMIS